jgi:hypothetical protein
MTPALTDFTEKEGYTGLIICANSWTPNATTNQENYTPPNAIQGGINGDSNVIAFAFEATGDSSRKPIPKAVYIG